MKRASLAVSCALGGVVAGGACGHGDGAGPGPDAGGDAAATTDGTVHDAALDAVRPLDAPAEQAAASEGGVEVGASVLQFHNHLNRDGLFIDPQLTRVVVATMHRDPSFAGSTPGAMYAQPLYVEHGPAGRGAFYVVTETNDVYALDEATGEPLWHRNVGTPAAKTGVGCGNIMPLGITGTPAIDVAGRTMFVDSAVAAQTGGPIQTHLIHALSIDDGIERPGWPFDASTLRSQDGTAFDPPYQNQRSALIVVGGIVYVAYGGHGGDCGTYHGWLAGIPIAGPAGAHAYATPSTGSGMWAPGGPSSDGTSVYVTTGNAIGGPASWEGNEAVMRFAAGPVFSGASTDVFAPANWANLDARDADLSGTGPLVIDAPGLTPSRLLLALGKDAYAYVLSRDDLGGVGGKPFLQVAVDSVSIIGSAAWYGLPSGTYFVMRGYYGGVPLCPTGMQGDLAAIRLDPASPTGMTPAWCAKNLGEGSPIVTTTDGAHDAIVWSAGAEASGQLHAWDAETGAPLFTGGGPGDVVPNLRRFTTLVAVHGRIFVGADDQLYAFRP
jgi:outer membrane protein assembly factor BamB